MMNYPFRSDRIYRMPTHFGPSLGPRQGLNGRRYPCTDSPKATTIRAAFEARASQLEKYLPPGFLLRTPNLIYLTFCYATNIEWLAGRGYNTFGVSIPASYRGQHDSVDGDLLLVLWENMADPIITGREDLGFSKVYCEIPEPQFSGGNVICRASWDGCQFAMLRLTGLKEVDTEDLPKGPRSEGILHFKYIPKTGCMGEADAAYPVITPEGNTNMTCHDAMIASSAQQNFSTSTWEELPTLIHIVDALSSLDIGECIEATVMQSTGAKDLSDQRILR